jgi:methyl-accepting chemotaxis protein
MRQLKLTNQLMLATLATSLPSSVVMAMVAREAGLVGTGGRSLLIVTAVLAPAVALGCAFFVARSVVARLAALSDAHDAIAAGDLNAKAAVTRGDELGQLAEAFNRSAAVFRVAHEAEQAEMERAQGLRATVANVGAFARRIAEGDLTARTSTTSRDSELVTLAANLNQMAERLGLLSGRVRSAATEMTAATSQILSVVSQNTEATSEQAASVAQTSVTIDEVRSSARQVSERAGSLATQAGEMMTIAAEGTDAVDEIVSGMTVIRSRVDQIGRDIATLSQRTKAIESITHSVSDLADQSNMLALNATIEAARAGEQGKGFAVVAQEVRSLAEQSKAATDQVRVILAEIEAASQTAVRATEEGSRAVEVGVERARLAGDAIDRMETNIRDAAEFATTIAASAREQHVGMDQIAQAMAEVSSSSTQMATGAGDTQGAAESLAAIAGQLGELTALYRIDEASAEEARDADTPRTSLGVTYDDLAARIGTELGVECAVVAQFVAGQVVPRGTRLAEGQRLDPFMPDGSGAFATVFRTGAPARIDDYGRLDSEAVAYIARLGGYKSSVCVPIRRNGELWGAVLVATATDAVIPRGAEMLLTRVARRAAALAAHEQLTVPG